MITLKLDENIVENFKAAKELQSMGFSDEQIQNFYEEEVTRNENNKTICTDC